MAEMKIGESWNRDLCPHCPADMTEWYEEEREAHRQYHAAGETHAKSVPSQDVKPSLPRLDQSREETRRNHIGWEMQ